MKKIMFALLAVSVGSVALAHDVSVHGYYRSNGTYVQPYVRTSPDSIKENNYSYPGNRQYQPSYYGGGIQAAQPRDSEIHNYGDQGGRLDQPSGGLYSNPWRR